MIRFILDDYSSDIIVLSEHFTGRVDFYYIGDFLKIECIDNEYELSMDEAFGELLKYYKTLIEQAVDDAFLIYDLSDQYIAAFHLEKFNLKGEPYWRTTKKYTTDITGASGVNKDISLAELKSKNWHLNDKFPMQSNRENLLKGIDWSLENLRVNTNPVEI